MDPNAHLKRAGTSSEAPTSARRAERLHGRAVLAVLGGRFGGLWWSPVAIWSIVALVNRWQARDVSKSTIQTEAYEALTISSLVALVIIWIVGSRLAVSLGHRRGSVFAIASIVTVGMVTGLQLLAEVAERIEHSLVGDNGIRVVATGVSNVMEEDGDIVPSPLFGGVFDAFRSDLAYVMPIAVALVVMVCWQQRWSWRGLLPGLLLVPAAFIAHMLLVGTLQTLGRGPRQDLAFEALGLGITAGLLLTLAWLAFRRAPV